jgi:hypothetical protein
VGTPFPALTPLKEPNPLPIPASGGKSSFSACPVEIFKLTDSYVYICIDIIYIYIWKHTHARQGDQNLPLALNAGWVLN